LRSIAIPEMTSTFLDNQTTIWTVLSGSNYLL
jgi:hypothetical protein